MATFTDSNGGVWEAGENGTYYPVAVGKGTGKASKGTNKGAGVTSPKSTGPQAWDPRVNDDSPLSGSGGGGSSFNKQKAIDNLRGLAGYNRQTTVGYADDMGDVYDIADEQNKNLADAQFRQAANKAGGDRWMRRGDLMSVSGQLRDAMGNAANGSTLYDYWDMLDSQSDKDEVSVLSSLRDNRQNIANSLFESLAASRNSRNQLSADTESNLREIWADYAAQANNIDPDIAAGIFDNANNSLNEQDWFGTKYFDDHLLQALRPDLTPLSRRGNMNQSASDLTNNRPDNRSAANRAYQRHMAAGYSRRTR